MSKDSVNDNEYLQERVMGECWHPKLKGMVTGSTLCEKCGDISFSSSFSSERRNFSTPDDFVALEDKMRQDEDLAGLLYYLTSTDQVTDYVLGDLPYRAALIAEYWRQR